MSKTYKTGIIITGDGKGGVKAVAATQKALNGLNSTTKRTGREFRRNSREVKAFLGGPARLLTSWWALAALGAKQAGSELLTFGDQVDKLSIRLGASTEALSEYQHVAELSGVQFNALTTSWQRQQRRLAEAAKGTGEAKKALEELGLSATYLNSLAPEQQFEVLADALNGVENEADRVRLAFKFWDSEGVAMLQATKNGSAGLREMREEARLLGKSLTEDQAQAVAGFNDSITRLKNSLTGEMNRALLAHIGDLTEVSDWMQRQVVPAFDGARQVVDDFHFALEGVEVPGWIEELANLVVDLFPEDAWDHLVLLPDYAKMAIDSTVALFGSMTDEIALEMEKFAKMLELPWPSFVDFVSDQWEEMALVIARTMDQILRKISLSLSSAAVKLKGLGFDWTDELSSKFWQAGGAIGTSATMESDLQKQYAEQNRAREGAIADIHREIAALEAQDAALDGVRGRSLQAIQDRLEERKDELDTMRFIRQAEREFGREARTGGATDRNDTAKQGAPIDPDALSDWGDVAKTALDKYRDDAVNISNEVDAAFSSNMKSMEDALVNFVKTGKLDFSSLADSIISDLIRIQVRKSITAPLSGMLNTFVSGMFGGGEVWSEENLMMVPANHTGGIVGSEGAARYVHPAIFADAPRLHAGGIAGDEVPTILKRREGVFTEGQMKALGMSQAQNIRVELINRGTPQQTRSSDVRFDAKGMVVQVVTEDISRNGPIAQSINNNFARRRSF